MSTFVAAVHNPCEPAPAGGIIHYIVVPLKGFLHVACLGVARSAFWREACQKLESVGVSH